MVANWVKRNQNLLIQTFIHCIYAQQRGLVFEIWNPGLQIPEGKIFKIKHLAPQAGEMFRLSVVFHL